MHKVPLLLGTQLEENYLLDLPMEKSEYGLLNNKIEIKINNKLL